MQAERPKRKAPVKRDGLPREGRRGEPWKVVQGLLIGLVSTLLALILWTSDLLERFEYIVWDYRVRHYARPGPDTSRIKLILLDQASLDWGKQVNRWGWPWPREVWTAVIDYCRRTGAKVVAFDILYTEPSIYGVEDDQTLGGAIQRSPGFVTAVALGTGMGSRANEGAESPGEASGSQLPATWPAGAQANRMEIEGLETWLTPKRRAHVEATKATFPVPEIAGPTHIFGNVTDRPDPDGVIRRLDTFRMFDGHVVPSLGLACYLAGRRDSASGALPALRIAADRLWIGERAVPIDRFGRTILRYRGPTGTHRAFSAAAVIQSELRLREGEKPTIADPNVFKDCYVLVGFSAPGLLDLRSTPLSNVEPGVEIHATQLDDLLSRARFDDFLRATPRGLVAAFTLVMALVGAVLVRTTGKLWRGLAVAACMLPMPVIIGFAGYRSGLWWPVVVQEVALVVALGGTIIVNYIIERREKTFIKAAFGHYLSPAVIARLMDDPSKLNLGGERRELSIYFSDIQGFSTISERLEPQDLTHLLNDYLSDMTAIILEEEGTLDKYEGDAIIAFWNAPVDVEGHAVHACRSALRCQRKLAARREEFGERAGAPLHQRIGINTGTVVVGNMGSKKRFDYTVFGDAANLASRLEGANKAFGTYLMVAEESYQQAREQFDWRLIGLLRVVGRATPVAVYEIMGEPGETDAVFLAAFTQGVELCRAGKWSEAQELYGQYPDDPVAQKYVAQCRMLREDPTKTWDGVWNLTEK